MNIFQLNCFLAVASSLSFAHAAKQMNVSQPAITNQIKTLEAELNAKLFRRSTRLVELTPEGQAFIADAKQIVAIAEQAKMRFSNPDGRKNRNALHRLQYLCPANPIVRQFAGTFRNLPYPASPTPGSAPQSAFFLCWRRKGRRDFRYERSTGGQRNLVLPRIAAQQACRRLPSKQSIGATTSYHHAGFEAANIDFLRPRLFGSQPCRFTMEISRGKKPD